MIPSSAGAGKMALALALSAVCAQETGPWWSDAGFSLSLPPGWQVERDVPGRGLALRPPDPAAPVVAVVTWRMSVGLSGPEGAAEEHERLLAAAMRYQRSRLEPLRRPGATEGVLVEGIAEDGGAERVSLFAAFATGAQAYVIGVLAEPRAVDRLRGDYLDPVLAGFALTAGTPAVQPSKRLTPEGTTAVAQGASPIGESGRTPAGITPAPLAPRSQAYTDPTGYSVALPFGWRCTTRFTCIQLASPDGAVLLLAPVSCPQGEPGWVAVADLAAQCLGELEGIRLLSYQRGPSAAGARWVSVQAEMNGQPLEGLFALSASDGAGVLVGLLGPAAKLDSTARAVGDVLASFQAELPDPPAPALVDRGSGRRDPSGPLVLAQPNAWSLRGGTETYDGRPVISLEGRTTDGSGEWFVWRQPVRPIFRELTDAMRQLGFRDGDPYYAYDGIDPRMVLSRGSASNLVATRLLPEALRNEGEVTIGREEALPAVRLLGRLGEEAALVETAGGYFIVTQASLGEERQGRFWEAACLGFGGPIGRRAQAARALGEVVRSAGVSATADASTREGLEAFVALTRSALDSSTWAELVGGPAQAALPVARSAGGGRRRYVVSAQVIEALATLASEQP